MAMRPTTQQPAFQVVAGVPGGPQVILDSQLNLPVTTLMPDTSAAASDITSISNVKNALRMPSGLSGETEPCIVAPVQVTYTDGTVADALLTLTGTFGIIAGSFVLAISDSSPGISKIWAQISGLWNLVGGAIQLTPTMAVTSSGLVVYTSNSIAMQKAGDGNLLPAAETTHALGALGVAHLTVAIGNYYALPDGGVFLSLKGTCANGLAAGNTAFPNSLPAALRPSTTTMLAGVDTQLSPWAAQIGTGGAITLYYPTAGQARTWSVQGRFDLQ